MIKKVKVRQGVSYSLIIAGKIPGTWLVQTKDAGHTCIALFVQYPDEVKSVLQIFLSTTTSIG
jgi:hypothetical protein